MKTNRRRLLRAACGCCAWGLLPLGSLCASSGSNVVKSLRGTLTVNEVPVRVGHPLQPGDRLATGPDSSAVVLFNQDAFQLRSMTRFRLPGADAASNTVELDSGAVLGAFLPGGERKVKVKTFTTLSIRGTGIAVGIQEGYADVCLCYGAMEIQTNTVRQDVDTRSGFHQGRIIQLDGMVRKVNLGEATTSHSSRQNIELEKIAGRSSPFGGGLQDILSIFESSEL